MQYPTTVEQAWLYERGIREKIELAKQNGFHDSYEGRRLIHDIQQSVPLGDYMYAEVSGLHRVIAVPYDFENQSFSVVLNETPMPPQQDRLLNPESLVYSMRLVGPLSFLDPMDTPRGPEIRFALHNKFKLSIAS